MLDLPQHPLLDKRRIVGGCVRLKVSTDMARLRAELEQLPEDCWGSPGGRVGVHRAAEAIFLRGHAPAEGEKPIDDRPVLDSLPAARELIHQGIPAPPLRCLLARLPAGAVIAPHVDQAPYFSKSLRLHFPLVTHEHAHMFCDGLWYHMRAGEAWALNNSAVHAVWNAHARDARTHLICDYLPTPALLALIGDGERELGREDAALETAMLRRIDEIRESGRA